MNDTNVIVEIYGGLIWQRRYDQDGNPSGVAIRDVKSLEQVVTLLQESLQQAKGQLDLLNDVEVVADIGSTAA